MHPDHLKKLLELSGQERFDHFVKRIADTQQVWGLHQDGWATAANSAGRAAVPFWSEEELAQLSATDQWSSYAPADVDLDAFMEDWLPGMEKDGVLVAISPTSRQGGVFVEPAVVRKALEAEIARLR